MRPGGAGTLRRTVGAGIPKPDDQIAHIESEVHVGIQVCFHHTACSERELGEGRRVRIRGLDKPDHPGLQLDESAELSSSDAAPQPGKEQGM